MDSSQTLPLSPESLQLALSAFPVAVCCIALADQRMLYSNRAFTACFGYESTELVSLAGWIGAMPHEEQRALAFEQWHSLPGADEAGDWAAVQPEAREASSLELSIRCKDGTIRTVLQSGVKLPRAGCALLTSVDISHRKQQEQRIEEAAQLARRSESLSRILLDHSHEMIMIAPAMGPFRMVSPGVEEITGWSQQECLGQDLLAMVHPDDRAAIGEVRRRILEEGTRQPLRYRILLKDGGYRWVEGVAAPYHDPAGQAEGGYVVTLRDIAKQKEQEETLAKENSQLAELAQVDELTGIANRRVFKTALNREARRRSRSSQSLALLLLDVDNFKKYNDLYGHLQGDACLRQVAQTLKLALHRVADLVARYGGEEFVMLLPMTEPEGAERVAQNVLSSVAALRIPHAATPAGIVTVSIGVSTWPASREMDEERLIEEADRALYRAKNQGRNAYCVNHLSPEGPA